MAKATALCKCSTCGKEFEVTVTGGNRRDADSRADWASEHYDECPECYRARLAKEREAQNAVAATAVETRGLPALTGSDKQIAWANTIRERFMVDLDNAKERSAKFERHVEVQRWAKASEIWLVGHTEAKWWIDNRDYDFDILLIFHESEIKAIIDELVID